jgi:drug/metabolite transporter (DMT)-like permease
LFEEDMSFDRTVDRLGGTPQVLRIAALVLFVLLAWEALDPRIDASSSQVLRGLQLTGYFLLGAICTMAFPRRIWIGIAAAVIGAIILELFQSVVPVRDTRWIELFAKWLSAITGVFCALAVMYLQQTRARNRPPGRRPR